MSLFARFRKDYKNYLIGIILPALLSGISIPVFKHLLGAEKYGHFSIYFNALLIATATLTGWIMQSIGRFYPSSTNKFVFAKQAISISLITQALVFFPFLVLITYIVKDFWAALLMSLSLFASSIQFSYLTLAQSSFLSKKTIYSETIRAVSYIAFAIFFLEFTRINYLQALFVAATISFTLSVIYLRGQIKKNQPLAEADNKMQHTLGALSKTFFKYGSPLSMWFVFAYMLTYIDKIFMLKKFGAEVQGNYQAIFDLLSRSITLILSPVVISLLPLLSLAYGKGELTEIRNLLKKIILFEIGGFILASILYWWFGADLLFKILKTPENNTFKLMGYLIIAGTFIWQIAIVVQKKYELKLKSLFLLVLAGIAILSQVIFYLLIDRFNSQILYPLGYLMAAFLYLFLVSFHQNFTTLKDLFRKIK